MPLYVVYGLGGVYIYVYIHIFIYIYVVHGWEGCYINVTYGCREILL